MLFKLWLDRLYQRGPGEALLRALQDHAPAWVTGVGGAARAYVGAALIARARRPTLVLAADEAGALELADGLRFFLQGFASLSRSDQVSTFAVKYPTLLDPGQDPLVYFPAAEVQTMDSVNREHGRDIERLLILRRLAQGEPLIVVASLEALCQKLSSPEAMLGSQVLFRLAQDYPLDEISRQLVRLGYTREHAVEEPGHFAVRGGIVDIAVPDRDAPVRLEFEGDTLVSLREFDPSTQKSRLELEQLEVMPFQLLLLDPQTKEAGLERILKAPGLRKPQRQQWHDKLSEQSNYSGQDFLLPFFYPATSLFNYLSQWSERPLVLVDQPQLLRDRLQGLRDEATRVRDKRAESGLLFADPQDFLLSEVELFAGLGACDRVGLSLLTHSLPEFGAARPFALGLKGVDLSPGDLGHLERELAIWMGKKMDVALVCRTHGDLTLLSQELSARHYIPVEISEQRQPGDLGDGELGLALGHFERGFVAPELGLVLLSDQEILRRPKQSAPRAYRHRYKGLKNARKIESFAELKTGDHAVHVQHGIGLFRGVVRLDIEGHAKDFVCLEYADQEKLYVPVDQVDMVQKYLGGEVDPRLHKLGGAAWAAARERVKKNVAALAEQLLKIYAARQVAQGPGSGPDSTWQVAFEESFPFEETEDQRRAIEDVKRDLEGQRPMDRLLCGDVGFGKTEVALRAAFKIAVAGQQVAVLVPTTLLAQQHYDNFLARLQGFPLRLDLLSSFRSASEQKKTVQALLDGSVDIVVGTHRLLSKDVQFKRLGLIIIDEEQRFGVSHKERLKEMRAHVAVLAMSATPVPRTLHFSLAGMRDMSLIETPPLDRLPVRTYVLEDDPKLTREAMTQELARGGQVFFVHNRVRDIEKVAARLRELLPEATVAVAHGQMPKDQLEQIMMQFVAKQHDVLVATAIIESGLDIPNVNTILIDHAEDFGLSQLYQLRGRVGRSERQAYCYLFYPRGRSLPEVAERRLAAIEEFTELGSGFKVAMRDLEIRGVGNILGPQQHGHVAAVGFDMYCHMLNEAVSQMKGEEIEQVRTPTLNLDQDAFIPETYIADGRQKLDWYKRLAAASDTQELTQLEEELRDRYGSLPLPVVSLLEVVQVRVWARLLGLSEVTQKSDQIVLRFYPDSVPGPQLAKDLLATYRGQIRFLQGPPPGLALATEPGQARSTLKSLLPRLKQYVKIPNGS